jgi:hypothetical protein
MLCRNSFAIIRNSILALTLAVAVPVVFSACMGSAGDQSTTRTGQVAQADRIYTQYNCTVFCKLIYSPYTEREIDSYSACENCASKARGDVPDGESCNSSETLGVRCTNTTTPCDPDESSSNTGAANLTGATDTCEED